MRVNLPIVFSQLDNRWASELLGNNTDSKYNIYNYGCLLCDLTAVSVYFGHDTDPHRSNIDLKNSGGFQTGTGNYIYGGLHKLYSDISEVWTITPSPLTDAQINEIKTALDNHFPVVIQIDFNPKTVALDSHFVTIVDYDPNDENNFTITDPLGGKVHSLKDYLGFLYPSARKTITRYGIFSGKVPVGTDSDTMVISKAIFPGLVHNSSQWDLTVSTYIGPDADSKATDFESLQNVISGIKSATTTAQNAAGKAQADLAVANQNVINAEEKVTQSKAQLQGQIDTLQAQLDAVSPDAKQIEKIKTAYQAQIDTLIEANHQLLADKHTLTTQLATATSTPATITINKGFIQKVIAWLQALSLQ